MTWRCQGQVNRYLGNDQWVTVGEPSPDDGKTDCTPDHCHYGPSVAECIQMWNKGYRGPTGRHACRESTRYPEMWPDRVTA